MTSSSSASVQLTSKYGTPPLEGWPTALHSPILQRVWICPSVTPGLTTSPVLLQVLGLSERLSLVGEVIVENWNTS